MSTEEGRVETLVGSGGLATTQGPSLTEKIKSRREVLQGQVDDLTRAEELLASNPDLAELLTIIGRAGLR